MKSLAVADRYGWTRYVAHQAYYSLIGREFEWELMPLGIDQRVGTIVWSPLGWGRLTGKIGRGKPLPKESRLHKTADFGPQVEDEYLYKVVDALEEVSKEVGKPVPVVALNWLLQRPTIDNVVIGARNEEQLRQNLLAVGWNLTAEQVAKLDKASDRAPVYPYWHQRQFVERNPSPVPLVPSEIGCAVLVAWTIQAIGGRWRPEPSWIDRAGRLLGAFWIMTTPFSWFSFAV